MIWCPQNGEAQHYYRDVEALHALSCLLDCAMLCGPPVDLPVLQEEIPERGRFAQPRRHKGPHEQVESCLQLRRVGLLQRAKRKLLQRRRIRPCLVAARGTVRQLCGDVGMVEILWDSESSISHVPFHDVLLRVAEEPHTKSTSASLLHEADHGSGTTGDGATAAETMPMACDMVPVFHKYPRPSPPSLVWLGGACDAIEVAGPAAAGSNDVNRSVHTTSEGAANDDYYRITAPDGFMCADDCEHFDFICHICRAKIIDAKALPWHIHSHRHQKSRKYRWSLDDWIKYNASQRNFYASGFLPAPPFSCCAWSAETASSASNPSAHTWLQVPTNQQLEVQCQLQQQQQQQQQRQRQHQQREQTRQLQLQLLAEQARLQQQAHLVQLQLLEVERRLQQTVQSVAVQESLQQQRSSRRGRHHTPRCCRPRWCFLWQPDPTTRSVDLFPVSVNAALRT